MKKLAAFAVSISMVLAFTLAGCGGGDEPAVVCGQPQDQVGGREVSEHLPVGSEQVQPIGVLFRQRGR